MESGPIPTRPSGWYPDPWKRFEYRYFNGEQWTSDVAVNGQRYVDAPTQQRKAQLVARGPSRGLAITSFIAAIGAVVIGWVPFVFVFGACAAVAAIVFGVLGLRAARRNQGHGRRFAVAGLALSPIALGVCVGGFFFTKVVVREFRDLVEAGPHEVVEAQPCTVADGRVSFHGTIRNLDDHEHDYSIVTEFSSPGRQRHLSTVVVRGVDAGQTVPWESSATAETDSVECTVTGVFGPLPFLDTTS